MFPLSLKNVGHVLCLGAHADDIEIGCGGTLLRMLKEHPELHVTWVVFSAAGLREAEAQRSAAQFLHRAASSDVLIRQFRDSFFPDDYGRIKQFMHELADRVQPDLIFTHRRQDLHQDHRVVAELTWNAFRDHQIWQYEIPKYDGDLGRPNLYVPLSEQVCSDKISTICTTFATQHDKSWFDETTFWSLPRLRGIECNSPDRLAEAFDCPKLCI